MTANSDFVWFLILIIAITVILGFSITLDHFFNPTHEENNGSVSGSQCSSQDITICKCYLDENDTLISEEKK